MTGRVEFDDHFQDAQVRIAIYDHFAETGRAPDTVAVGERCGTEPEAAGAALERLAEEHVLLLDGGAV